MPATTVLAARVPSDVATAFATVAQLHHRTVADELRLIVEEHVRATARAATGDSVAPATAVEAR